MHLTNEQLNEYLDNASTERAFIETHLDSCGECVARLSNLQALFADLDSLPEATLSRDIAARFRPRPSLASQLPRWLTLTASLQAASTLVCSLACRPMPERAAGQRLFLLAFGAWMRRIVGLGEILKIQMGVDLRGTDAGVAQHFLHCAQIAGRLQHVAGKGMAQGVWIHMLRQALFLSAQCQPLLDGPHR